MSIEFACGSCASRLKVPDGTQGQPCECPSCGTVMDIPLQSQAQAVQPDKLSIPCPKCKQVLLCSPKLLGSRGQCQSCKFVFSISESPVEIVGGEAALTFSCPACQQLFDGKPEMSGQKGKCHVCGEVFQIEFHSPAPQASPPNTGGDATVEVVAQEVEDAIDAQPTTIQVVCGGCDGVMELPGSAAGCTTQCPFCQVVLQIPG